MISEKLVILSLIAFNIITAQKPDFSLSGKTSDITDGTYLYLRDLVNGGNIDSALVRKNTFRFNTDLPEPTLFVMLFTKDRSKFKELWLEESTMTFDATECDFKNAKVTGSKNQTIATKLNETVYANVGSIPDDTLKQKEKDFINDHSDALLSAYILYGNHRWTQNEIGEFYSKLSGEVQTSSLGKKIAKDLEKDIPTIGEKYTDFNLTDPNGKPENLSDSTGKLTLLQFWSSSCDFSREMNSILTGIYRNYHSKGLEIISVSGDTNKEDWLNAIKEDKANWSQLSNLQGWNGEVFSAYGIRFTPSNFLIDEEGIIVARNLRGKELERKIKEYLK
ncbi:AhpC/TSA family protein [Sinomicrobium kalidii]|uniref:TlpA disulfide reductase family protein n=1 Tax=Sinomicrobium kalidii TaxID=2900738 RepID=UPI001E43AB5A|nr:TlpA disulfide reductase family protein [Sinomicrobium kalidii]UGU14893.1 AhpC/TSA family protein [Sinomicrobium kalidii]